MQPWRLCLFAVASSWGIGVMGVGGIDGAVSTNSAMMGETISRKAVAVSSGAPKCIIRIRS